MPFTKSDLVALSGLPDRTLRNYMGLGLIPRATGHGLAAVYDDDAMVRAVAIGRMRASGQTIGAIMDRIEGWSTARFKKFVAETDPPAAPAASPSPPAAPAPGRSAGGDAARPARRTPDALYAGDGVAPAPDEPLDDLALPPGPVCRVLALLPGLVLMVDGDAPPIVHRVAAEICARYGGRRA
ncbi:MAG TPA: MerR family transcriptional regulator [Polyangiaceae bacterium]